MTDSPRLTPVQWTVCVIASIGFAFDIYELLMLPLILRPALLELSGVTPADPAFAFWRGILFFVPAFFGGLFGLWGGYLTDKLGRRRVLTWSILLYAFSAFAAGLSTNIYTLLFFRCTTFAGVCVEFVAAVAWLAELFPDPKQRERVLGYTQFFSSLGGLMVAFVNHWLVAHAASLPAGWLSFLGEIDPSNLPWRYTLMSGILPALPLIVIRPFLPESPAWQARKLAGTLKRPSIAELFSPELKRTTVVTTLMFACSYGAAFGALQQSPQIAPAVPEVRDRIAQATEGKAPPEAKGVAGRVVQDASARFVKMQEYGGLAGRLLLAVIVTLIASQRNLLRVFLLPGLLLAPLTFGWAFARSESLWSLGLFLFGLFTVGQFSFWGNYLPRVFPMHLRGTGESFAANIGGRILGTSFALVTSLLSTRLPGDSDPQKMALAAAIVGTFVYVANLVLVCWLPQPSREELPD
jgi:MFS family permease